MPALSVDVPPTTATRRSRTRVVRLLIASIAGLGGALVGYEASEWTRPLACAASRSPLTVGLYLATASALAAWALTCQKHASPPKRP